MIAVLIISSFLPHRFGRPETAFFPQYQEQFFCPVIISVRGQATLYTPLPRGLPEHPISCLYGELPFF
jgi:hypothetical protein